jgi:hypothetical protein
MENSRCNCYSLAPWLKLTGSTKEKTKKYLAQLKNYLNERKRYNKCIPSKEF